MIALRSVTYFCRASLQFDAFHIDSSKIGTGKCCDMCDMFCLMANLTGTTFLSLPVAHWRCIQVRPSNTRQHCYTHLVPWWRILHPAHDTWLRLELAYSSGWVEDEVMMTTTFCARRDVVVMLFCQEGSAGGASFPHQPGGLCFWLTVISQKGSIDLCERLLWAF